MGYLKTVNEGEIIAAQDQGLKGGRGGMKQKY